MCRLSVRLLFLMAPCSVFHNFIAQRLAKVGTTRHTCLLCGGPSRLIAVLRCVLSTAARAWLMRLTVYVCNRIRLCHIA